MTKRSNPSKEGPLPKRSLRRTGFHVARPASGIEQPPTSSNSSLFVTVHKERRGCLKAQSRLLSSTPYPPTRASTPTVQSNPPETAVEHTYDSDSDWVESTPQVEDQGAKPKRKRNTKNKVYISSESLCATYSH